MSLKPFNLERALAGDPVVAVWTATNKVSELYLFKKSRLLGFTIEGKSSVNGCDLEGKQQGNPILFMAPKKETWWFVRSNKVNTQGASGIPGYWQSNVLVGEEGRKYLVDHYAHRLGHELTLHSQEIEE